MNCKPGDLAVIVKSQDLRNIGKIVKVLRLYARRNGSWYVASTSVLHGFNGDWPAGAEVGEYDLHLRPIRDNPGNEQWFKAAPLSAPSRQTVSEPA